LKWSKFNTSISQPIDRHTTYDTNEHGRYEQREIEVFDDLHIISKEWCMVQRLLKVISTVTTYGKTTYETRYYISDLTVSAKEFLHIIRSHWRIENSLHYGKDVAFLENFSRMRTDQTPVVASLLRSMAINVLYMNHFSNITQTRKLLALSFFDLASLNQI
jgi:predicted transposase YbfD/YdcC